MRNDKQNRLRELGFRVGTAQEFAGLTGGEAAMIDLKITLIEMLKSLRAASGITQQELARRIRSSQSRIAKIEAADPSVSLDLICRALLELGASRKEIGKTISSRRAA